MAKKGARGMYQKWLLKENLVLLQGWKLKGLTDKQISEKIGVSAATFDKWKAKYPEIRRVVKVGKEQANYVIENKLYKKAESGNTTAMIFYFKNNYREKYTDSTLTVEELEVNKARARKIKAEADILEAKAAEYKRAAKDDHSVVIINDVPKPTEEDDDD